MNLYLCGAGNPEGVRLAIRINRATPRWDRITLLDDDPGKRGQSFLGVEVAGPLSALEQVDPNRAEIASLVARTTERRMAVREKLEGYGLPFATLVDPSVDISGATLGNDVIVYQNAVIGPEASVGDTSVVLMAGIVGHESDVARCCIVAPNAVINARVVLGEGAYVGTNSTILPELEIGPWATVAAGSVVMQNIPERATVMGVPAKVLITPGDKRKMASSKAPVGASRGDGGRGR